MSRPVFAAQGAERSTAEVTLFMGDYGYTPFGIHLDDPFTSVVHCHFGPAVKTMTLFNIEEFHRLNGKSKNCFEPSLLIPFGKTYAIRPGDIFLLPPHYYHVGHTDGFSIGIAVAISKYPEASTTQRLLQHAIADSDLSGGIAQVIERAEKDGLSFASWLRAAHRKHLAQAESRGRLRYSPRLGYRQNAISKDALWLPDPDFPITCSEHAGHLSLFARGHQIRMKKSPVIYKLLEKCRQSPASINDLHRIFEKNVFIRD
ncbi:hypothetical protein ABK905_11735 [Acerihabitans sp. KWT182]|uniref:JmjC domain-containing protein n=1 Tax=Acerihabitans sp. KWT182 TaxID=3157919 RepID=A0AAU7QEB3_9GAMM